MITGHLIAFAYLSESQLRLQQRNHCRIWRINAASIGLLVEAKRFVSRRLWYMPLLTHQTVRQVKVAQILEM
jgi:hypothetical protein